MPEGVPSRNDMIREQIGQVWAMLLGQMTQEGATREEIVGVTLDVTGAMIETTASALWPEGAATVATEQAQADHLGATLEMIRGGIAL